MLNFIKKLNFIGKTSVNIITVFIIQVLIVSLGLATNIAIARLFGKPVLGMYSYFMSLTGFILLFVYPGFSNSISKIVASSPSYYYDLNKKALISSLLLSLVVIPLSYLMTSYLGLNPALNYFYAFVIVYIILSLPYHNSIQTLRGFEKFTFASFFDLLNRIFVVITLLILFLSGASVYSVFMAVNIALMISILFQKHYVKNYLRKHIKIKNPLAISFKKLFTESSLFFFVGLSTIGIYAVDRLSIKYVLDFSSLGLYEAYSNVVNIIRLSAYVLPFVLIPMATKTKYQIKKSFLKIMLLLLPFALIVGILSYYVVPLLFGAQFKIPLNYPLPWLMVISASSLVIFSYFNSILLGENMFSKSLLSMTIIDAVLSMVVNFILNIYFLNRFGIIGAPIATIIVLWAKIIINVSFLKHVRHRISKKA